MLSVLSYAQTRTLAGVQFLTAKRLTPFSSAIVGVATVLAKKAKDKVINRVEHVSAAKHSVILSISQTPWSLNEIVMPVGHVMLQHKCVTSLSIWKKLKAAMRIKPHDLLPPIAQF